MVIFRARPTTCQRPSARALLITTASLWSATVGTDMPRHPVKVRADGKLSSAARFEHEMFFAMADGGRVRQSHQLNARLRVLRGDRLVTEIQAETVRSRFADDARQDEHRRQEVEVREVGRVVPVPEDRRTRTALDVRPPGVYRERWRASRHDRRNLESSLREVLSRALHRLKASLHSFVRRREIGFVKMAVIRMQPCGAQPGQCRDQPIPLDRHPDRPLRRCGASRRRDRGTGSA